MYYTEDEKKDVWARCQIEYAERAHNYMCCDLPTIKRCWDCNIDGAGKCHNKKDIMDVLKQIIEDFI